MHFHLVGPSEEFLRCHHDIARRVVTMGPRKDINALDRTEDRSGKQAEQSIEMNDPSLKTSLAVIMRTGGTEVN